MQSEEFVLGVDLDDVVGDYANALRRLVAHRAGKETHEISPLTNWDILNNGWPIKDRADFEQLLHHAVTEEGLYRNLAVIEQAPNVLWRLRDFGVRIRIITHRLHQSGLHRITVADTVEWLDAGPPGYQLLPGRKTMIPYDDLCFMGDKAKVGADLYIDDAEHNITALRAQGAHAVVFSTTTNRHVPGPAVASWEEFEHYARDAKRAFDLVKTTS